MLRVGDHYIVADEIWAILVLEPGQWPDATVPTVAVQYGGSGCVHVLFGSVDQAKEYADALHREWMEAE
jgi:hypothetical protein